jgi:acyl-CoA thioesterase I
VKGKMVAIGDSLTYGFPFSPEYSWVAQLAQKIKMPIMNRGVNGDTTGEMLARFQRDVLAMNPALVIIMGGSNDVFMGIIAEEMQDNIRCMIRYAAEKAVVSILGLPPPCIYSVEEECLGEYRHWLRLYAAENQLMVIDFATVFLDALSGEVRRDLFVDGVHPNEAGYERMIQPALTVLQEIVFRMEQNE